MSVSERRNLQGLCTKTGLITTTTALAQRESLIIVYPRLVTGVLSTSVTFILCLASHCSAPRVFLRSTYIIVEGKTKLGSYVNLYFDTNRTTVEYSAGHASQALFKRDPSRSHRAGQTNILKLYKANMTTIIQPAIKM